MIPHDVVELYKNFLIHERRLKDKTVKEYLSNLNLVASKVDIMTATTRHPISKAIHDLKTERGWGEEASTAWRCAHDIVFFYKWALAEGVIQINPYPFNSFRKPQYHAVKFTTEEEFCEVVDGSIHLTDQDKLMLWTYWDTGLRREELQLLDQKDFLLEEDLIFLPQEKSKGGYGQRYVALSPKTKERAIYHFKQLNRLGVGPHAFCGENFERINPDEITARVIRAGKVFAPGKFIKINPRALRHALPIRMLERGASDLEIMANHGHANVEMTRRYTHSTKSFAKGIREKYLGKTTTWTKPYPAEMNTMKEA